MSLKLKLDAMTKAGDEWAVYVKVVEDTTGEVVTTVSGTYSGDLAAFKKAVQSKLRPIIQEIRAAEAGKASLQTALDTIDLSNL